MTTREAIVLKDPPRHAPITATTTKYPETLRWLYFIMKKQITRMNMSGANNLPLTVTLENK